VNTCVQVGLLNAVHFWRVSLLFLAAYACSGLAGLVYEVAWTRLLTLHIGHTTAAASAVVAAFLGGLAAGAAFGGLLATRLSPARALLTYVALELAVVVFAFLLPWELQALTPVLRWAYADAAPGMLFPTVRVVSCLLLVLLPACALGATFPVAVRWRAHAAADPAAASSALYALNTVGAAAGSVLAGFTLIPNVGVSGTTKIAMGASAAAAALVTLVWLVERGRLHKSVAKAPTATTISRIPQLKRGRVLPEAERVPSSAIWIAAGTLGLSGFASLVHEIAWTRILALVLGPTTYAFAATLAAVVAGVAIGSGACTRLIGKLDTQARTAWLAIVLGAGALSIMITAALAGSYVPGVVAAQVASSPGSFDTLLRQGMLLTAALILPTSICMGAAFPLGLSIAGGGTESAPRRFGAVYAVNTIGSVSGTLAAGFLFIPWLGLQSTLAAAAFVLVLASVGLVALGDSRPRQRALAYAVGAAAVVSLVLMPPWNRALLSSGVYLYAPFVPKDLDLRTQLEAGTLLYYKDGAPATVSVKRLTGTTTLAVDGKTDASNRSDMITQKLVAHLPLLLHPAPRDVAIVGLGSGVTLGAALSHPIERVDVVEISPEVVEASRFFEKENHGALADPRTRLVVGDGRSHLLLSRGLYDVIISEPSNPWIAGVAALFTREFFEGARSRLAPGGIICQWAHTYTISDRDLRSIVRTFTSVFPNGTAWMVNDNDVLMVASAGPVVPLLDNIARHWSRGNAAADLAEVGATEPFHLLSLFSAGPGELARYAAGADLLDDDRMRLEFSAPRELHNASAGENDATFASIATVDALPALVRTGREQATSVQWRGRAEMMTRSDAYSIAYDDYVRALKLDPTDRLALEGFTRTAVLTNRAQDALSWIRSLTPGEPGVPAQIAISKLLAAAGLKSDAIDAVKGSCGSEATVAAACEQLAAIYADAGDAGSLEGMVARLRQSDPGSAATHYFDAVLAFLHGDARTAIERAQKAITADPGYSAVYDLAGAAHTKLGEGEPATEAFLTSLRFDPHDSAAYTNLGLLALTAGDPVTARNYFAEALWLAPDARAAREGLERARSSR
jgi:spermidine synthase